MRSRRIALGPLLVLCGGRAVCCVDVVAVDARRGAFAWRLANPRRVEPIAVRTFGWIVHVPDARVKELAAASPIAPAAKRKKPKPRAGGYWLDDGKQSSWNEAHARAVSLARELGARVSVYKRDPFGCGDVIAFTIYPPMRA